MTNGKVLVAGGIGDNGILDSAELYDPATGYWTPTGSLNDARVYHTATLLPNGQVLVAGGDDDNGDTFASAEHNLVSHGRLVPPPASLEASRAVLIRPPSWPTAKCSSLGATTVLGIAPSRPARNFMTRPPAPGRPRAASPSRASVMPPPCCPTAGCSSSREVTTAARSWPARMPHDPATGAWSPTGSMENCARRSHCNAAAQWHGACRGRRLLRQRGAVAAQGISVLQLQTFNNLIIFG